MIDGPAIREDWQRNWTVYVFLSLVLPALVIGISVFIYPTPLIENFGGPVNFVLFYLIATTVGMIMKFIGNGWIRIWPNSG